MMKVLYIAVSGLGGSNVALLHLVSKLKVYGVNPLIIVPDNNTAHLYEDNGIATKVLTMRQEVWPKKKRIIDLILYIPILIYNILCNFIAYYRIIKVTKTFNPDIIHTNVSVISLGYKVAQKMHIPHVWHIREYISSRSPFPSIKKLCLNLKNSNTITITRGLIEAYGLDICKNRVIYDSVSVEKASDLIINELPNRKYIIFVGRVTVAKGIDKLINAYIDYAKQDENLDLLIVGSGTKKFIVTLQNKLDENNLNSRVRFMGSRNHSEVMSLISNAQALVVSSLSEGFGLTTIEAMYNNCVVIGYNNTGTKEQFDNGLERCGQEIGIRYNTHDELVNAMRKIANSVNGEFDDMKKNAKETVEALYLNSKNSNLVHEYYKDILNNK